VISVRLAREADVEAIRDVYLATYGGSYGEPEFYDLQFLKKIIFSDDTIVLVAEDNTHGVVATAAVVLELSAYSDLVGEFGRLAVHPDMRGQGIGTLLMEERLRLAGDRLHVGYTEARAVHQHSQRIAERHGFGVVGFLPLKLRFGRRESAVLLTRYFGEALALRRNNPRIIPETYPLAAFALEAAGLPVDPVVDDHSPAYPPSPFYELDELTTQGHTALLRLARGRLERREVFGPMRLHYGFFKIRALNSTYLVAREHNRVVGAIGVMRDIAEDTSRVFEVIALDDGVVRFLFERLEETCTRDWKTAYIEADVSAYAPRMQRTLIEQGFAPVAYVPALAFHRVERLDVVKMGRVYGDPASDAVELTPAAVQARELVLRGLARPPSKGALAAALASAALFEGLTEEQRSWLAGSCRHRALAEGETLFAEGQPAGELALLLTGEAEVCMGTDSRRVGVVRARESVGELALLLGTSHSASVVTRSPAEVALLSHADLAALVRRRPDIGIVLYRNLAAGLGEKLRRTDDTLLGVPTGINRAELR
jgi:CRP/FNR family transcriptional regulator